MTHLLLDLICLLILNSLMITGIYNVVDFEYDKEGNPANKQFLWFIPYYTQWLPELIKTPLYDCIKCMASVHGTYIFWGWAYFTGNMTPVFILIYIFYTFALSGLNTIIHAWFSE